MIDPSRSNPNSLRITVPAATCRFGSECLLCGAKDASPTPVEFKRVVILGIFGGGQTLTLDIPLCSEHASSYRSKKFRVNLLMTACFVIGFLGITAPSMFNMTTARPWMLPVCGTLILMSFILLLSKNSSFPVKVSFDGMLSNRVTRLTFKFPDAESMQRFLRANEGTFPSDNTPVKIESDFGSLS